MYFSFLLFYDKLQNIVLSLFKCMELNMLNNLNEKNVLCPLEKEHRVIIIIIIIVIIMYLFVLTFLHSKIVFLKLTKNNNKWYITIKQKQHKLMIEWLLEYN